MWLQFQTSQVGPWQKPPSQVPRKKKQSRDLDQSLSADSLTEKSPPHKLWAPLASTTEATAASEYIIWYECQAWYSFLIREKAPLVRYPQLPSILQWRVIQSMGSNTFESRKVQKVELIFTDERSMHVGEFQAWKASNENSPCERECGHKVYF